MNEQLLRQQKEQGFPWLRFAQPLETQYREECARLVRLRARPVAICALILFAAYAGLDWLLLPSSLSLQTMLVRLVLVCPLALAVLVLSYSRMPPVLFERFYAAAYLLGGLAIVLIIFLARRQGVAIPYDGLHLMLMFGFFVMGLPFRTVSVLSAIMVGSYLAMEWHWQLPEVAFSYNAFFIVTALAIGMVGAWLREHAGRHHFLDRAMLDLASREAQADSDQKTRFIAAASHDLRHPLNVINLLLENLRHEAREDERIAITERLRQSVGQLNRLLGTLLDLSRIKEGMVVPELRPVSVARAFEQLLAVTGERARQQGMRVETAEVAENLCVEADPVLLHRILVNLVHNALEHSGGTRVRLTAARDQEKVSISVADDGVGISSEAKEHLFEAFFRSGGRASHEQGLGLGLAISLELSELMGGECEVASRPGQGSEFRVTLPAAQYHSDRAVRDSERQSPGALAGKVLLAEDHPESRQWLKSLLQRWGYAVADASGAEAARRLVCDGQELGLVITDLHLKDGSGMELVDWIRQASPGLPAIIITADTLVAQQYDSQRRLWVLHKPLSPGRLRAIITQLGGPE